jgi:hypothetical protein
VWRGQMAGLTRKQERRAALASRKDRPLRLIVFAPTFAVPVRAPQPALFQSRIPPRAALAVGSKGLAQMSGCRALCSRQVAVFGAKAGSALRNRPVTKRSKSSMKVYITGITSRLSRVEVARPPITTVAMG